MSINDTNLALITHAVTYGENRPTLVFTNLLSNQSYRAQVLVSNNDDGDDRRSSYELISGDLTTGTVVDGRHRQGELLQNELLSITT